MPKRSRSDEEKQMLQQMAETWDSLAEDREAQIERRKRIEYLEKIK